MKTWKTTNNQNDIVCRTGAGDVPYLSFPLLEQSGLVHHGFSTRMGGVSTGIYESMNLSFTRGDEDASVRENFERFGAAIGVRTSDMVFSRQTHTSNVRIVTEEDRGKGIVCPVDYANVDGLVTDVPGLCLVTFYADCVPLFFLDPVRKVIGLSHSGWRGTVAKIGLETVKKMQEVYGSRPEDTLACIGPSICQSCYEVSSDVIDAFREAFSQELWEALFYEKPDGKYQLNLWKANEAVFAEAGILPEHIAVTNICTNCNPELLYSHRASGGRRGSLAAFLALKETQEGNQPPCITHF